jgi:hypothetical protein
MSYKCKLCGLFNYTRLQIDGLNSTLAATLVITEKQKSLYIVTMTIDAGNIV